MDPPENLNEGSFSPSKAIVDHYSDRGITDFTPTKLVDNFKVYCILRRMFFKRKRRKKTNGKRINSFYA
jgi:hypothetical protein